MGPAAHGERAAVRCTRESVTRDETTAANRKRSVKPSSPMTQFTRIIGPYFDVHGETHSREKVLCVSFLLEWEERLAFGSTLCDECSTALTTEYHFENALALQLAQLYMYD
eukprot:m.7436 g.7436  ORF g.7436 m.7436 type:complete len:111 (+) comp5248_c0_seq1:844-1176(+)